jgi:hypothetical protein
MMVLQTKSPTGGIKMNTKIRTLITTLAAAASIATVAVAPAVSQAQPNNGPGISGLTQEELEKGGASCEHAGDDFWVCTKDGHEWYCNHEGCGQVNIVIVKAKLVHVLTGLKVQSVPVVPGRPVVVVKTVPRAQTSR